MVNQMENAISEYQKWKQQGETLRTQAKQAMENRFRELLTEAARISHEYHADFGVALKPPPQVTAFRFKALAGKAKTGVAKTEKAGSKTAPKAEAAAKNPALEKRLAQAKAKLDAAKTAGKPTRNLEDKIYEIEDEIRLASQTA